MSEIELENGRPVIKTKEGLWFNKYAPREALEASGKSSLDATEIQFHTKHGTPHYQQNFYNRGVKDSSVKTKSYVRD